MRCARRPVHVAIAPRQARCEILILERTPGWPEGRPGVLSCACRHDRQRAAAPRQAGSGGTVDAPRARDGAM
ncbi:hypothetical protein AQ477_10125 [Burkholderia thailandensis]|nr:hypothetical protein AQ477_10125 [Burkholderia thailandensis]KXF62569.1 hypothetical protein AQ476_15700 [Burkholderia thailandensis]